MTTLLRTARERNRRVARLTRTLMTAAVVAGWLVMPLMPILALAFVWFSGVD